jgi:myo-inositol-1(or 4)-monophosphatase
MTRSGIDDRFDFACQVIRDAGAVALRYFSDLSELKVQSKGVQDMVSEADIATENLIRDAVESRFPDDAFLGEESTDSFQITKGAGTWIVDPIDGTQPFVNGIRSWCVSIAYVEGNEFKIGVVFDPNTGELFAAQSGRGATMNGKSISCSPATRLSEGLVSVGFSNRVKPEDTLGPLERLMRNDGMYHRSGCGALSLSHVAAGRLIGYFEPHMNSWDFSAAALIVQEAGGKTNDCLPNEAALLDGGMIIAACAGIYAQLEAVVFDGDIKAAQ